MSKWDLVVSTRLWAWSHKTYFSLGDTENITLHFCLGWAINVVLPLITIFSLSSNRHQVSTCPWWGGWPWWQTTQSTRTSSCWLTLKKVRRFDSSCACIPFSWPKPSLSGIRGQEHVCIVLCLGKYFCHITYSNDTNICKYQYLS